MANVDLCFRTRFCLVRIPGTNEDNDLRLFSQRHRALCERFLNQFTDILRRHNFLVANNRVEITELPYEIGVTYIFRIHDPANGYTNPAEDFLRFVENAGDFHQNASISISFEQSYSFQEGTDND